MTFDKNGAELPDYLTREQIEEAGGDPDELLRQGIRPITGNAGVECWPRDVVVEWLSKHGRDRT